MTLLTCVLVLLNFVPLQTEAEEEKTDVTYQYEGIEYREECLHMQKEMSTGWYAVSDPELRFDERIVIQGDVDLILVDGTNTYCAGGIYITEDSTLTIWGQSSDDATTGRLTAHPENGPGIGGISETDGGNLVVNGGYVIAEGGENGAGIGGGYRSEMRSITINAGSVEAYGKDGGTGIGSGRLGDFSGTVTINGGRVKAVGSDHTAANSGCGAGIGGGEEVMDHRGDEGANVFINGGRVYAGSELCAIGHGGTEIGIDHTDSYFGNLSIASGLMVHAGNADEELFSSDSRAGACHYRKFARIEPCDDHDYSNYVDITPTTHTPECVYCADRLDPEGHSFDENGRCILCDKEDIKCTVTFKMLNDADEEITLKTIEVTRSVRYLMPAFAGEVPAEKGFRCWFMESSTSDMPGQDYSPGEAYSVSADTIVWAHFYDLPRLEIDEPYADVPYFKDYASKIITADRYCAEAGEEIVLSGHNSELYRLASVGVSFPNGEEVEVTPVEGSDNQYSFIMPAYDVKATYKLLFNVKAGGYGSGGYSYGNIYLESDEFADAGDTVIFKALADGDSCLDDLMILIKDKYGYTYPEEEIAINKIGENRYSFVMPRCPVIIAATFKRLVFTVVFQDDDGTILGTYEVKYGDTPYITPPEKKATEYTEFIFDGWYDEEDNRLEYNTPITGDTIYTARYIATNQCTVSFVDSDRKTPVGEPVTIAASTALEAVSRPSADRQGKNFAGWYTVDDDKWDSTAPIINDLVLCAQYYEESVPGTIQNKDVMIAVNDLEGKTISNRYNDRPLVIRTNNGIIIVPANLKDDVRVPKIANQDNVVTFNGDITENLDMNITDHMSGIYLKVDYMKSINRNLSRQDSRLNYTEVADSGFDAAFWQITDNKGNAELYDYPGTVSLNIDLKGMGISLPQPSADESRTFYAGHNYIGTSVEYLRMNLSSDQNQATITTNTLSPFDIVYKDTRKTRPYNPPVTGGE